jgi:hypothetical protein
VVGIVKNPPLGFNTNEAVPHATLAGVGVAVGATVGAGVGVAVDLGVGVAVGALVGVAVGRAVGVAVATGGGVGVAVGTTRGFVPSFCPAQALSNSEAMRVQYTAPRRNCKNTKSS